VLQTDVGYLLAYCCCFIMQLYKTRAFLNSTPASHLYKVRKFTSQHSEWTSDYSSSSGQMVTEKLYLYGWSRRELFSLSSQEEGNFHHPELSWRKVLRNVYSYRCFLLWNCPSARNNSFRKTPAYFLYYSLKRWRCVQA